jgi:hypothetical protein
MPAYVIEKGVPLPAPTTGAGRKPGETKYPFRQLEVGDSVFFSTPKKKDSNAVRRAAYTLGKKLGRKFAARRQTNGDSEGVRVWRTE